jgi:hypothetical protein
VCCSQLFGECVVLLAPCVHAQHVPTLQVKKINEFTDARVTDLRQKLRSLIERSGKETTDAGKAAMLQVRCRDTVAGSVTNGEDSSLLF